VGGLILAEGFFRRAAAAAICCASPSAASPSGRRPTGRRKPGPPSSRLSRLSSGGGASPSSPPQVRLLQREGAIHARSGPVQFFCPGNFGGSTEPTPHALRQVHPWPGLPTAAGGWTLSGACCHGAGHTHVEAGMAAERQGSRRRKHLGYSFLTLRLSSRYRWFIKKPFIWTRP